jgi:hypothetical protein
VDTAPTVTVSLEPGSPGTNATVLATAVGDDADGTPLTYTYTWTVNGATRRIASTSATTDSFDLWLADQGDRGDVVAVSVVAADGRLSSPAASASVAIVNSAPSVSVALSTTTPGKRDVVTATAAGSDADRDALTYTFTWRLDGAVVQTVSGTAATSSFDLRGVESEYGDVLSVAVVTSDGAAQATAGASATLTVPRH